MSKFSEILVSLRKHKNITQQDLAKNLGVSRSIVGMYETGQRMPSFEVLEAIAKIFDVSIDYLVGHTERNESVQFDDTHKSSINWFDKKCIEAENAIYIFTQDIKNAICNNRGCVGPIPEELTITNNHNVHLMSEAEKTMLDLFQEIPPDQQPVMLAMMRVFVEGCRPKEIIEEL